MILGLIGCQSPATSIGSSVDTGFGNTPDDARSTTGSFQGWTQVSTGLHQTCALPPSGHPVCWGCEGAGADSNGLTDETSCEVPAGPWDDVATGGFEVCYSAANGTVCTGGTQQPPAPVGQVSLGGTIYCGASAAGPLCWDNSPNDDPDVIKPPPQSEFVKTAAGLEFACGLTESGTIECWGPNVDVYPPPTGMFKDLDSKSTYVCALDDVGVQCWGHAPMVAAKGTWDALTVGHDHVCAYTSLYHHCWGAIEFAPTTTVEEGIVSMDAGYRHTCAIRGDGRIQCWGDSTYGAIYPP
jgi:hypothetical protein